MSGMQYNNCNQNLHRYNSNVYLGDDAMCRRVWVEMSGIDRRNGKLHFSTSSLPSAAPTSPPTETTTPTAEATENGYTDCLAESDTPKLLEHNIKSESTHLASSAPSSVDRRIIRMKRTASSTIDQQHERTSGTNDTGKQTREYLNGYRYRLLATPQLKNDLITVPEEEKLSPETSPSATQVSQMIEKENHDIQQLQQEYVSDEMREQNSKASIKDVFSSTWWRTLYQSIGNKASASDTITSQQPIPQTFQSSIRNRRASILLEEIMNNEAYTGFLPDERRNVEEEEEGEISDRVRVRSVQAASSIDVVAVLSKVFGGAGVSRGGAAAGGDAPRYANAALSDFFAASPPLRHVFGRTNIIIQLSPPPVDCPPSLSHSVPRYVAIYRFGSVVFFNCTTKEASRLLEQIKKHAVDPMAVGFERREHFEVALQPHLETASGKITADRALVRELDMNTVGVVSNIMGQTVALDWHNDVVDELLAKFSSVNSSVERTGGFTSIERHTLFQVVARNNSLFIDMVGKLGIKDRSDTGESSLSRAPLDWFECSFEASVSIAINFLLAAWHLSQYEGLHEGMRKEFELDDRFRNVQFKLDLIQQNAKFFLEVMHAQKSNSLEWCIIVLISFECILMILDMSGWGEKLLSGWSIF